MTAARSKASPNSTLQIPRLIGFLLGTHSPGLSAGLCHLCASPTWHPWSQMGCMAAVAAPGDGETQVPFLPLPGRFMIPFPTPYQPAWGTVCSVHRMLTVPGAKEKPSFFSPQHCGGFWNTRVLIHNYNSYSCTRDSKPVLSFSSATSMQEECWLCCTEPRSAEPSGNTYPVGPCRGGRQRTGTATQIFSSRAPELSCTRAIHL